MGFVSLSLQYWVWGIALQIVLNLTLKSDYPFISVHFSQAEVMTLQFPQYGYSVGYNGCLIMWEGDQPIKRLPQIFLWVLRKSFPKPRFLAVASECRCD